MCYNITMSKDYKKCPRCNNKTPKHMPRCGVCSLSFEKFNSATNAEAKSAFRMGESERVLYTTQVPSDVNKMQILINCIFGGWFGLHHFKVGRRGFGLYYLISLLLGVVYMTLIMTVSNLTGYVFDIAFVCGIAWIISIILWWADIIKILCNGYKYPISLPYSNQKVKGD